VEQEPSQLLTNLSLTNFKAWKHIDSMRLAPITSLFGTNSSGKSAILQFLLMLKQTADSTDRGLVLDLGNEKSLASLGTFRDLVTAHDTSAPLAFSVDWTLNEPLSVTDPEHPDRALFESNRMTLGASISSNGAGLAVSSMRYGLGDASFSMTRKGGAQGYELSATAGTFRFKRAQGRKWPLPAPVKFYGFADEVRSYHQNAGFLSELELAFERMLRGVSYLGPLRDFPRREYTWAGGDPADMGRRGEYAIAAILSARERGEKIGRGRGRDRLTLEQYVAHWLKELGLIHEFRIEEIKEGTNLYRVHVRKAPGAPEVLITDVGFGVSQVLPVLVLCYYAPEGSTILFEQPEIHLHPRVQSGLADVFIDAINVRKVQIIVESHSEHFLLRLQRRIAEGQSVDAKSTALYFCDVRDGASQLTSLDVDMYGNIRNWPVGFFSDEMEERAAMIEAARRRRAQGAA
jgi:hypothetical protein